MENHNHPPSEYWQYKNEESKVRKELFPRGGHPSARDCLWAARRRLERGSVPSHLVHSLDRVIVIRSRVAESFTKRHPRFTAHQYWLNTMRHVRQILKSASWKSRDSISEGSSTHGREMICDDQSFSKIRALSPEHTEIDVSSSEKQNSVQRIQDSDGDDQGDLHRVDMSLAVDVDLILFFEQMQFFTNEIATSFQQLVTGKIDFVTYALGMSVVSRTVHC